MTLGGNWRPTKILRISNVLETSTKPLHAETDQGMAIVKYMGNPAGDSALTCELIGSELARAVGLHTPDFCIASIESFDMIDHPLIRITSGPAFFSRWEPSVPMAPDSQQLKRLGDTDAIAQLVVFDTWIQNGDRFEDDPNSGTVSVNFDNLLFKSEGRNSSMLVIDHTHAFVETTLDDELGPDWVRYREVFGLFPGFEEYLTNDSVKRAISRIQKIDLETIRSICKATPIEWGMTPAVCEKLANCLYERKQSLGDWVEGALCQQSALDV